MAKKDKIITIENKIINITNNLISIDSQTSIYIKELLIKFAKKQNKKDTIELVDNIDIFLTSMNNTDKNNLKNLLTNNKSNKVKLNIFLKEFNKVSPFTQLNSEHIIEQKFKTAGGGKPDTVIIRKLDNGKTKYFYSAASHSPDTPFEDMQLFVQPMKLKLAIDEIKDIEDVNSLLVENYAEQEQIYKKSNTYEIFEYIDENIGEIIDDKIDFFEDLEINGTFSHPDIKIVKNIPQKQIYKGLAKKYKESTEEEIEKRSQWLFIVGQLATGYDKINLYAEYSEEEKEKHKSNLTKVIDKVLSKITYQNQILLKQEPIQEVKKETFLTKVSGFIQGKKEEDIQFNNMNTVFDENFLSEESIIEFLDLIIDKTKPYTFVDEKSGKTVTRKQSVLNTKKIITSFALSSSYISNKFNGNEEIQNKLQKIADITELTTIDLLFKAKSEAEFKEILEMLKKLPEDKYLDILIKNKDKNLYIARHVEDLMRKGYVFETYAEDLTQVHDNNKKDSEIKDKVFTNRYIKDIKKLLPDTSDNEETITIKNNKFSEEFCSIMSDIKVTHLDFLKIMKEVGEIPNSLNAKNDIEIIITIFKNLNSILDLTIEDKLLRDLFNEVL